ncbi:MAG: YlxR family protein [Candidatus Rokubacteria bacterium]|nr:YlxR family protein [Candidatus Rokubacteria bacterium]
MTRVALRTCLGCRQAKAKVSLVRLTRDAGGVVHADARGTAPGRGAYLCADPACLDRVVKGGRFAHAFRKPCSAGAALAEEVRELWQQRKSK